MGPDKLKNPLLTVLLPVYNAEKYIKESISSILAQTFEDFELIIIDDGSTDKSKEAISSFKDKRIRFFKNNTNLKLINTLNKGIKLARGKYLARIDADDICFPKRFQKQISFLENNKNVAILGTDIEFIDKSGNYFGKGVVHPQSHNEIKWGLQRRCCIYHPTTMVNLEKVKNEFFYSEQFVHAEDYELWLRIAKNYRLANLPEVLLKYRVHSSSITQKFSTQATQSMLQALSTHRLEDYTETQIDTIRFPWKLSSVEELNSLLKKWKASCLHFIKISDVTEKEAWLIKNNAISLVLILTFLSLFKFRKVNLKLTISTLRGLGINFKHLFYLFKVYNYNIYHKFFRKYFFGKN
ncbi:glycosyltransferase [Bacteriovoracales bacterium]|nr:glycosyltransferase [Bacteriovoracales bacterium]